MDSSGSSGLREFLEEIKSYDWIEFILYSLAVIAVGIATIYGG